MGDKKDAKKDQKKAEKHGQKMGRLERRNASGKISYDQLVNKGDKALTKLEKRCSHAKTTPETFDDGTTTTWCDACGARV